MRQWLLAAGGALALAGSAQAQDNQPSLYQSREVAPGAFDKVEVSGPFNVGVIIRAGVPGVHLSGPPALLADTIATVEGDTLKIRFRDGATWSWNPGSGMHVLVSAPALVAVRLKGAGDLQIGQVRADTFSAATEGAGSIVLRGLDAGRVQFASAGSGGIRAEGRAREGAYASAGSGSIDAKRLRVENASLAVGGSGSIYADVSRTAKISVGGSGRVEVVGGAACNKQPADSPQIECR